jgi:hypothetical protein
MSGPLDWLNKSESPDEEEKRKKAQEYFDNLKCETNIHVQGREKEKAENKAEASELAEAVNKFLNEDKDC